MKRMYLSTLLGLGMLGAAATFVRHTPARMARPSPPPSKQTKGGHKANARKAKKDRK